MVAVNLVRRFDTTVNKWLTGFWVGSTFNIVSVDKDLVGTK